MQHLFDAKAPLVGFLLSAPCWVGCLAETGSGAETVGAAAEDALASNALASNALASNALTSSALASSALLVGALTSSALTANTPVTAALADENARVVFKYIVSCALPAGQHIDVTVDGTVYGYDGGVGLAPSWGTGPGGHCDNPCVAWVSGCVLSRVNYLGVPVALSLRGGTGALSSTTAEQAAYPSREAAYYGNIFSTPPRRFACLSPGAPSDSRVCGPSLTGCVMNVVGACDQACDNVQHDGSFPNCRDGVRDAQNKYPAGAISFPGSVTVFLQ